MEKHKPGIDLINEVLEECILFYPVSSFIISIYKQYQQRGSLSKKQLEGLYGKASKIDTIDSGKLAGLEAIIKRMPTRYRSEKPVSKPLYQKDESVGKMVEEVLQKYPGHKGVLFLKSRYENNEFISTADLAGLRKIWKMMQGQIKMPRNDSGGTNN